MKSAPQTVHQTIKWLKCLGRPSLPECPVQAATVGKHPKQPAFISGWQGCQPFVKSIEWKHWQTVMPPASVLAAWFKDSKTGIGTLGGNNGKHWLGWVDFDVKDFPSQAECDRTVAEWTEQYSILKQCPRFRTPAEAIASYLPGKKSPRASKLTASSP